MAWELGAETGLLKSQARRMGGLGVGSRDRSVEEPSKENGWLGLTRPELPDSFGGRVFIGNIWGEGCRV